LTHTVVMLICSVSTRFCIVCIMKEISDEQERMQTVYGLIARLPPVSHDLLERLVFHLTRLIDRLFLQQLFPLLCRDIMA